jgi:hypothetical protein
VACTAAIAHGALRSHLSPEKESKGSDFDQTGPYIGEQISASELTRASLVWSRELLEQIGERLRAVDRGEDEAEVGITWDTLRRRAPILDEDGKRATLGEGEALRIVLEREEVVVAELPRDPGIFVGVDERGLREPAGEHRGGATDLLVAWAFDGIGHVSYHSADRESEKGECPGT